MTSRCWTGAVGPVIAATALLGAIPACGAQGNGPATGPDATATVMASSGTTTTPAVLTTSTRRATTERSAVPLLDGALTSATAGSGTSGVPCAELSACCPTLPAKLKLGCGEVVTGADPDGCAAQLKTYMGDGYCGGVATSTATSTTAVASSSSGSSSSGSPCGELAACCLRLSPSARSMCAAIVSSGDAASCGAELTTLMGEGSCGGASGGSSGSSGSRSSGSASSGSASSASGASSASASSASRASSASSASHASSSS